jgi:hypothetical protein
MTKVEPKAQLITPVFRMGYTQQLITPKAYIPPGQTKPQGAPKHQLPMIFTEADIGKFRQPSDDGNLEEVNIKEVCKKLTAIKWPGVDPKTLFTNQKGVAMANWPIKVGNRLIEANEKKEKPRNLEHLKDCYQITASSNEDKPPKLSYIEAGKRIYLLRDNPADMKIINRLFLSGYYAVAELSVLAQETPMGNFITFYLNHVQYRKEGERIGGGGLMERFEGVLGGEADVDPTLGSDDDDDF